MIDVTLENFETEVMLASTQVPVLVDIWAEWCGPCKQLGPVLEQLEAEYAGRFVLAKLDADKVQQLAGQLSQMFGVRSIPFCVLFKGGQPVDGFVGALPAAQVREFLDKHVPSEGALTAEADVGEAEALLQSGDTDAALAKLADAVAQDPGNDDARADYIRLLIGTGAYAGAVVAALCERGAADISVFSSSGRAPTCSSPIIQRASALSATENRPLASNTNSALRSSISPGRTARTRHLRSAWRQASQVSWSSSTPRARSR